MYIIIQSKVKRKKERREGGKEKKKENKKEGRQGRLIVKQDGGAIVHHPNLFSGLRHCNSFIIG